MAVCFRRLCLELITLLLISTKQGNRQKELKMKIKASQVRTTTKPEHHFVTYMLLISEQSSQDASEDCQWPKGITERDVKWKMFN